MKQLWNSLPNDGKILLIFAAFCVVIGIIALVR